MNHLVYGECVQGYSHKRKGAPCQDSFKIVHLSEDIMILAVADGHGSSECPYSKTGSMIAVNVFCKIMADFVSGFDDNMERLGTFLHREGEMKVAQSIELEWKKRVWKVHTNNKREKVFLENGKADKRAIYKQYGTTLLGLLITPDYIFALQLGDGDIIYVDTNGVQQVLVPDKLLGVETYSLSNNESWKKMISIIHRRDKTIDFPYLYILSTDGFANSYPSQNGFYQTCKDYFEVIKENGFKVMKSNMKEWLDETSKYGSGDDIAVVMVYYD